MVLYFALSIMPQITWEFKFLFAVVMRWYGREAHPSGTGYHSIFYHLVLPKYLPWPFSPFFLPRILLALNVLVYPRHLNIRKLDAVWMVIHHFCEVPPCIYRVLSKITVVFDFAVWFGKSWIQFLFIDVRRWITIHVCDGWWGDSFLFNNVWGFKSQNMVFMDSLPYY